MIMLSSWMFAKSGREGKNGHALEASSHGQRRPLTDLKIKQFTSRLRSDHVLRRRVSILLTRTRRAAWLSKCVLLNRRLQCDARKRLAKAPREIKSPLMISRVRMQDLTGQVGRIAEEEQEARAIPLVPPPFNRDVRHEFRNLVIRERRGVTRPIGPDTPLTRSAFASARDKRGKEGIAPFVAE